MLRVGAPALNAKLQGHIMQINFSEKELEDFLCQDRNLEKYFNINLIARQVMIPPAGIVDILGYSRDSNRFVIIELKRDILDLQALSQGLSYLTYYQKVRMFNYFYRKRTRKFSLLLIGQNLCSDLEKVVTHYESDSLLVDNEIYYTLFGFKFNEGISFNFYNKIQNNYESQLIDQIETLEYNSIKRML